ncbi:translocation/assembly module TamB domain-containing protein [Thalassobius sp. Cn5-15]|uniref:translocation/assembly module TamB domain-containing protein n=1 Tax=Thalassobius sp. Cn5-15 TaxID=2917763 RepID=UPI001EF17365|nr:translocation/assembly module TamB domain-containing protein [Thalassobius sp. Cn5-15]MCG7495179.1 translocation/assembly module TamB domain-containing protein [Thalassobius sp. Cn5-15]
MRQIWRHQTRLSALSCCVAVIVALTPLPQGWAQDTAEDGSYLETLLEDTLSQAGRNVEITGFRGALSSKAELDSLSISDDTGVWLRLEGVELDWTRSALLRGALEVNSLNADRLHLPRLPVTPPSAPSPETTAFALPELPVSVNIGSLGIREASIGADVLGQATVMQLDGALTLADGAAQGRLRLDRRDTITGHFDLQGSFDNASRHLTLDLLLNEGAGGLISQTLGLPDSPALTLALNGAGPLSDFNATTRLSTDGAQRVGGSLSLQQDPKTADVQRFEADLGGDLTPLFAPEYRAFFGPDTAVQVSGIKQGATLRLDHLSLRSDALNLGGKVTLENGWPRLIDLSGQMQPPTGKPYDSVLLPLPGADTRVAKAAFQITHDATRGPNWALDATLTQLQTPALSLATAQLTGEGQINAAAVAGTFQIAAEGITATDPALQTAIGPTLRGAGRFTGDQATGFTLSNLSLSGVDYGVNGGVRIHAGAGQPLTVTPDLQLKAADLNRFEGLSGSDLEGRGDLRIKGPITPLNGGFDLTIAGETQDLGLGLPTLDSLLADRTQLDMKVRRDSAGLNLSQLILSAPSANMNASAQIKSQGSRAELDVVLQDASTLDPGLQGGASLTLTAKQGDTEETAQIWQVNTDFSGPRDSTLTAQLTLSDLTEESVTLSGTASAALRDLKPYATVLRQALPDLPPVSGGVTLALSGSSQPKLQQFDLIADVTSQNLAIANPQLDALIAGRASLTASAKKDPGKPIFLRQLDLTTPELTVALTGVQNTDATADIRYTARLRDLARLGAGVGGAIESEGRAELRGGQWRIATRHQGPGNTRLATNGTVAQDFTTASLSTDGVFPLGLLNPLIQPRNLQGNAQLALRLDGPPRLQSLSGQIRTSGARLSLPTLRQSIEEITGQANLSGGRATLNLNAKPALGGSAAVTGGMDLSPALNSDITLTLRDFVAEDPSLYSSSISGALSINGALAQGSGAITGTMELGPTELRIPANAAPRFASLPGLKHVNEPADVRRLRRWAGLLETQAGPKGPAIAIDISLSAPDRVFVRGRGLDAELGGRLQLSGTTHQVIPEGQFELIRGRLDILGNRLTLTEGLIQLQGAFDPFIRFVAETTAEAVIALITIEGNASAPSLRFTSSPELPEDEVLSLLLFGRDLTSISPLQAVRLASAIATLSGQSGGFGNGVRQGLALDDLDVTTAEDGSAQARVGKYISDNIYTEVTADTAGNTRIDLNLQISPSITARGRLGSDGDTGIGLFIERDY